MSDADKQDVAIIVANLFKDGKTALQHFGIDPELIRDVEIRNPHVSKQYPSA